MTGLKKKKLSVEKMDLSDVNTIKIDRTVWPYVTSNNDNQTAEYWVAKSPQERFVSAEFLRLQWIELNNLSNKIEKVISFKPLHEEQ